MKRMTEEEMEKWEKHMGDAADRAFLKFMEVKKLEEQTGKEIHLESSTVRFADKGKLVESYTTDKYTVEESESLNQQTEEQHDRNRTGTATSRRRRFDR